MELQKKIELPEWIPVLPVRNTVVFPNAAVPLIVGRPKSVQAIRVGQAASDLLLVVSQKDGGLEEPKPEDLYPIGVVCVMSKVTQVESDSYQLIVNGLFRFLITDVTDQNGFLSAQGRQLPDLALQASPRSETLAAEIKQLGKSILSLGSVPGSDALIKLFGQLQDAEHIADLCCTFISLSVPQKQELLEYSDLEKKLTVLLGHMIREKEKLILQNEIQSKMMERLSKDQRDHLLREQLRTIHEELGEDSNPVEDFAKRIEEVGLPPEAKKVAKEELSRLHIVQRSSPEYHVIRTYLDWILCLPWSKTSGAKTEDIDLLAARAILDADHFGLAKVKKRILQFLAVAKLKKDQRGSILCLTGPPGVGKTSLGRSIAKTLGRPFVRASLGGVRDEAEIRGHRRTYIGAMPGRIIQSLKRVGAKDPVMLLDEIDKLGSDFRGDPSSALLEVLDPEQNNSFVDHYVDAGFDLSRVFFITTANVVENIPSPLRDRMEIIEMTSYSNDEKLEIATRHLLPKLLEEHGLSADKVKIDRLCIEMILEHYTREAGVRQLTREIANLCRAAAEKLAGPTPPENVVFNLETAEEALGPKKFFSEEALDVQRAGIVTGLAWTPVGGQILHIEATRMEGKGKLILTGQLGDVMKESAQIALSVLRSSGNPNQVVKFENSDFHIHVPAGAIPKDGPSAGVAIFLALSSLLENRMVSSKIAFTGELTLRGSVLPVGGIKEKVLAAHRAGIETICLPERNRGDLTDVSPEVKAQLKFIFLKDAAEALAAAGSKWHSTPILPPLKTSEQPIVAN